MSTAANPGPNNLLMLAVLGIGAYWFLTRRAVASTAVSLTAQQQQAQAAKNQKNAATLGLLTAGTNVIGQLLTKIGAPGSFYSTTPTLTQQGYLNASYINQSDSNPDLNGSVADWASSAVDGLAINPPGNNATFDWLGF